MAIATYKDLCIDAVDAGRMMKDVEGGFSYLATLLRSPDDEIRCSVLADPDGNEFCAFAEAG